MRGKDIKRALGMLSSNPEKERDRRSSHTPSTGVIWTIVRARPSASVSSSRNPSSLCRMLHYSSAEFPPPPKVQCGRMRCERGRRRNRRRLLHFNLSVSSFFSSDRQSERIRARDLRPSPQTDAAAAAAGGGGGSMSLWVDQVRPRLKPHAASPALPLTPARPPAFLPSSLFEPSLVLDRFSPPRSLA